MVTSTQHQGDTLANGDRLEKLHHIGMGGAQNTDVIDVDDHITWWRNNEKNERTKQNMKRHTPKCIMSSLSLPLAQRAYILKLA